MKVVCGVRIDVAAGNAGTRGESVVSSEGNISAADGGRARWKDCFKFPGEISGELWEDLPYRLPFMLNINDWWRGRYYNQ